MDRAPVQNCRDFPVVPEQTEAGERQEAIAAQAAETEIPKVPTAPTADLPAAEEPAEENTDHHLWQWY
jgi:hypothetical protein